MRGALLVLVLLLTGCASDRQGGNASNVAVIKFGVIESVKPIELDASSASRGTTGSVFGQVGGASAGSGRGAVVGSILGSVLGGVLGQQADIATQPGLEIWVKLDEDGKSTYVMQPGKPDAFKVGDRVRVLRKNGEGRVEPIPATGAPAADTPATPTPAADTKPAKP
ncbi:MAG TPA: hypothetical protein VFW53_12215 [Gallionella sp.]|nr:hypothetical protein [Gallionella sp.]